MEAQNQKAFITGITGCLGRHLASHLLSQGVEVFGLQRKDISKTDSSVIKKENIFVGDLLDSVSLKQALGEARPTHIYHLAGCIDRDIHEGQLNYEVNVAGTIKLLNAVRAVEINPRILITSSSAVYGATIQLPIKEESELRPLTHYAVSKISQEMVALQYHLTYGLPIVRARTFNVIGPDLAPSLLCSEIARQIAQAEKGGEKTIRLGNLRPQRDYTDVRDVVRAYEVLMQSGKAGEVYNVCTMTAHSVQECLDGLLAKAKVPLSVEIDQTKFRAAEIEIQVGDATKLKALNGWKPKISFAQSLEDLLNSWRSKLQGEEL